MTRPYASAATQLSADADRRRIAMLLYPLRREAYRIVADCERMLEGLHHADRTSWRDAVGESLIAGRHLLAISAQAGDPADPSHATQRITTLGARILEPQRRIVDAMTALVQFVPVSPDEELLLEDARAIRDTARNLLIVNARARTDREGSSGPKRAATLAGDASAPTSRVLVVDDDSAVRAVLLRQLKSLGHEVREAENGEEGLELAQREPFDLILTDINMPKMTGMAFLKELKASALTRDVPVIVISSQDDLASVVTCIEYGAEDHLPKPFQALLLKARVRASLERKRLRDVEVDYQARVTEMTGAAEAVESESYVTGSLDTLGAEDDALGRLARVFDRMVTGLRSREERLQRRLVELRRETEAARGRTVSPSRVSEESPFASGEILAARYEVIGELGRGGMGMVYRARDIELGEEIALKVVRRDIVRDDPTIVDRLKSEIRLARKISHRNVVRAHDLGEWKGTYFITMEFVNGITVEQLIDRRGRLTVESTLAIGTQLAEALGVAHEVQVVHRDIKPANLLVDGTGVLKVMDFGIARSLEREDNITQGGFIIGTPSYMAPEQLMGGTTDARSDLFAVGVVLYECLSGRLPFSGDSPMMLLAQISDGDIVPLGELVPNVPPSLEALIYRQLQFRPEDRIGSAREFANKLAETEHAEIRGTVPLLEIDLKLIELD